MIAVAKSLLSGLETTVTSTTKKDGNTPPFADTFQQASANQTDQSTKVSAQRLVRTNRASAGGKKTSAASSVANSVEQVVVATNSKTSVLVKGDGGNSAPVVAEVVEATSSDACEQAPSVVPEKDTSIPDVTKEQVGADVEVQAKTVLVAATQPLTKPIVAQAADEAGKNTAPSSALQSKDDVSQPVATVTNHIVKDLAVEAETHNPYDGATISAKTVAIVPVSISLSGSTGSTSAPYLRQASGDKSNTVNSTQQSSDASSEIEQTASEVSPKSVMALPSPNVSSLPTIDTGRTIHTEPAESSGVVQQAPAPVQLVSPGTQVGQSAKSVLGITKTKPSAHGLSEEASGKVLTDGVPVTTASQLVPVAAAHSMSSDGLVIVAQAPILTAVPKLEPTYSASVPILRQVTGDGASSLLPVARGASIEKVVQGPEIVTHTESAKPAEKATSKQVERTHDKMVAGASSQLQPDANLAIAVDPSSHVVANANLLASVEDNSVIPASVSAVVANTASTQTLVSSGVTGRNVVASSAAITVNAQQSVTSIATDKALSVKPIEASASNGIAVRDSNDPASEITQEAVPKESAIVPLVESNAPKALADNGPLHQEAVVAAANSLVKSGQQHGTVSGNTLNVKERKAVAAETKPTTALPSTTSTETATTASITTAASASASTKPGSEHQAAVVSAGHAVVLPVGNVESLAQVAQSPVAPVMTAPAAVQAPPGPVSAEALTGGENSVSSASSMSLQGTDHGLSPLAHTTLSATPTVLEVGVPGGTQGWLKIRAEIGEGGVVQASMSSSTHAGQYALRRDLPAMTAFLESEHVPVNVQVLHGTSTVTGGLTDGSGLMKDGGFNPGSSLGQSLNQNSNSSTGSGQGQPAFETSAGGSGSGQSGNQQREADNVPPAVAGGTQIGLHAADSDWSLSAGYGSGSTSNGGSWLNVIA